jgi:hypothetical protein
MLGNGDAGGPQAQPQVLVATAVWAARLFRGRGNAQNQPTALSSLGCVHDASWQWTR